MWEEERWLADDNNTGNYGNREAKDFITSLADNLGIDQERIVPGYEDTVHYLLQEDNLPVNVDPMDNKLKDPLERERLSRTLRAGLEQVAGFALPLKWLEEEDHKNGNGLWKSSAWPFRADHMFLLPGDSSMGYRLPLASLPWKLPDTEDLEAEPDPFADRDALPDMKKKNKKKSKKKNKQERLESKESREIIHTAVCIEAREGRLHVFMPPFTRLEGYLHLINSIEATATALKMPVMIEGYEPPWDPRISKLQITPDPGVIEVNIHPAHNWQELTENTQLLYEEARQVRLGTEKFMIDGRHSGTGGGNHVTLGGPTPADSPFLRRPDLLGSLVTYWQHHPALSYLFSGLFIGPTSQAPRVDEARDDNLYELEIALAQLPEGKEVRPWLVDRVMRNFLVDLTGNTHRSEFCIDKLYSPDSPTGRLGLVELRAFEMPPHARMSLVQMLLLRALVACFWQQPCKRPLIRWGTELHDRFMLPHFVWEDLKEVVSDLRVHEAREQLAIPPEHAKVRT